MTTFRPLNNYIQIQPIASETVSRGIILTQGSQNPPTRGKVLAIGPGKYGVTMPKIKVGAIVAFATGSIQQLKAETGNVYVIEGEAIIGVEE
jgi:co-chaperonin GroES (HSP10)